MKAKKMERLGAIQYARTDAQEQQLTELGYKVIGEEVVPDVENQKETPKDTDKPVKQDNAEADPLEDYTVAELREMLKKAGVNAPASANKAMLIDIAHASGM